MEYRLPIKIERLEEGGYLAHCPAIQGCHAEGHTIGEAIDNLRSVAQAIYELCQEKGLCFVTDSPNMPVERIIWQLEFSLDIEATP